MCSELFAHSIRCSSVLGFCSAVWSYFFFFPLLLHFWPNLIDIRSRFTLFSDWLPEQVVGEKRQVAEQAGTFVSVTLSWQRGTITQRENLRKLDFTGRSWVTSENSSTSSFMNFLFLINFFFKSIRFHISLSQDYCRHRKVWTASLLTYVLGVPGSHLLYSRRM